MITAPHYFGCVGSAGHYPIDTNYRSPHITIYNAMQSFDGKKGLIPGEWGWDDRKQVQGCASLSWQEQLQCTLLAFWDRSVDDRAGSWSGFFLPGKVKDPAQAVELAKAAFPNIWARFQFEVHVLTVVGF